MAIRSIVKSQIQGSVTGNFLKEKSKVFRV